MYYVITEEKVYPAKELADYEKLGFKFDYDEFKKVGTDYIANLTNEDLDFVMDKKKISRMALGQLYSTGEKQNNMFFYIILLLQFITLVMK